MARFNLMVLLVAAGAALGTALRPGLPEVAIGAALVCGAAAAFRRLAARRTTQAAS